MVEWAIEAAACLLDPKISIEMNRVARRLEHIKKSEYSVVKKPGVSRDGGIEGANDVRPRRILGKTAAVAE